MGFSFLGVVTVLQKFTGRVSDRWRSWTRVLRFQDQGSSPALSRSVICVCVVSALCCPAAVLWGRGLRSWCLCCNEVITSPKFSCALRKALWCKRAVWPAHNMTRGEGLDVQRKLQTRRLDPSPPRSWQPPTFFKPFPAWESSPSESR